MEKLQEKGYCFMGATGPLKDHRITFRGLSMNDKLYKISTMVSTKKLYVPSLAVSLIGFIRVIGLFLLKQESDYYGHTSCFKLQKLQGN